ncbi:MAG: helix-turn-helix transcriptional regulator [Clostridiales bacterium]|nr:helix-turn-helix transcriptional regulator [Clostridiales bacterium]
MFKGFNKISYGSYLKRVRLSKGLTQLQVQTKIGITTETLRRLENGKSLPTFRTLEDLSVVYSIDLLKAFMSYRDSNVFYEFYSYLDGILIEYKLDKLKHLRIQFSEYVENNDTEMFSKDETLQFEYLLKGLDYRYSDNIDLEKSTRCLLDAIEIGNSKININSLDRFTNHYFSYIEVRCLYVIAINYGEENNNVLSNKILLYLLDYCFKIDNNLRMSMKKFTTRYRICLPLVILNLFTTCDTEFVYHFAKNDTEFVYH